jgi:hypothetical protein
MDMTNSGADDPVERRAVELLQEALNDGGLPMHRAICQVANLCIEADYRRDLWDFYLLCNALDDLREIGVQGYWNGATADNIQELAIATARAFLATRRQRDE